jgi:hypothetical protein
LFASLTKTRIVKIKMRIEHRPGEVLAVTVKHQAGPGRGHKTGNGVLPVSKPREITKMQSSRAQQLACLAWEDINSRIDAQTAKNERASLSRQLSKPPSGNGKTCTAGHQGAGRASARGSAGGDGEAQGFESAQEKRSL